MLLAAATRPAAVAGRFYPGGATALAEAVDGYLSAQSASGPPPKLLLAPHAGYVYSGPIAGAAYAQLAAARGRITRVVLLGPTHRVPVRGLAVPSASSFETPLGALPVDRAALRSIASLPQVVVNDATHAEEHALEVQLPFLQRVLGASFNLVPLAVGRAEVHEVAEVLEALWGGDETLVVISSDLSHYLPYGEARARDRATIERVLRLEPDLDHDQACGATPLAGALVAARRHGLQARLLDLRNSGDTAGDRRRVVGYGAVAFAPAPPEADEVLGQALIGHAREAISTRLGLPSSQAPPHHDRLTEPGATFVTLRRSGALRGCIGTLAAHRALGDDVRAHALAAAFSDPRFPPLAVHEFTDLEIEVSLLEPATPLPAMDESQARRTLRPGVDGVILEWRGRRATFLPQVWEQLSEPAAFLQALRRKAGLAEDFWADDLQLARYAVRKFVAQG